MPRWVKKDLNLAHEEAKFQWKAVPHEPTEHDLSPVSLFESIFMRTLVDLTCRESNSMPVKGHQNFDLDVPTLAILLLSGYVPLPRCPMYWEVNGDVHNLMVSGAVSHKLVLS